MAFPALQGTASIPCDSDLEERIQEPLAFVCLDLGRGPETQSKPPGCLVSRAAPTLRSSKDLAQKVNGNVRKKEALPPHGGEQLSLS